MRRVRRILHMVVPAVGMALVIGAVFLGDNVWIQLFLVIAGLMLTEAGIWRLAEPILPDDRRYLALRAETDHFMALVRQLNTAAVALQEGEEQGSRFVLEEVRTEMQRSIERMVEFAGKTPERAPPSDAGASLRLERPEAG